MLSARGQADSISIHAPREGSDTWSSLPICQLAHFYPRSPRGERPRVRLYIRADADFYPRSPRGERQPAAHGSRHQRGISIHAPREGSDRFLPGAPPPPGHFYPRSPRGERHTAPSAALMSTGFLSTLPARGATNLPGLAPVPQLISIHAPREGSDPSQRLSAAPTLISIHAPREGSDA